MARTAHPLFRACLARDKARRADANAALPVVLHQLRKDGQPSGMHDARRNFPTRNEAVQHVAYMRSLNPTRNLRYSVDGVEV